MLTDAAPVSYLRTIYEPGRRCGEDSCITILCHWNPGPKCYCHTKPRPSVVLADHERQTEELVAA